MGYMEDWVTALARILVIRWLFSPPMPVGPSQGNVENMAMKGSGSQQKKRNLSLLLIVDGHKILFILYLVYCEYEC